MAVAAGSGYNSSTGIYDSKLPTVTLPDVQHLTLPSYIFVKNANRKEHVAVVDGMTGHKLSYGELEKRSRKLAAELASQLRIGRGEIVLILTWNCVDYAVITFATMLIGAVVTTGSPSYTAADLERQFLNSKIVLVFSTENIVARLWPASAFLCSLRTVLIGPEDRKPEIGTEFFLLSELLSRGVPVCQPWPAIRQDEEALVLYSSGTTGVSKGVVITHRNLISAVAISNGNPLDGFTDDDVYVCSIPQFHVYGFAVITCAQLGRGATVVILPRYTATSLLGAVQQYRITHVPVVPPILLDLVNQGSETLAKYDLSSLRQISCGAAPLHRNTMENCSRLFPGIRLHQGYGLTESTALGSTIPAVGYKVEYFGSVGLLASNMQAKVINLGTNRSLPPNQVGEIWIRGPGTMKGYRNNPRATAEVVDEEGWLHTGDVGYFNDEGYLYVVDRIKELIKFKGFQVAPAELEALLLTHPSIQDAAVIPYPDDTAGEIPMAFVVTAPGNALTEEDVIKFIEGQVATFKKVRKVEFVPSIPKLPSGKILRKNLIQEVRRNLQQPRLSKL